MLIKDISVYTYKNHIETEISFDQNGYKEDCYFVQTVYPVHDKENIACQMTAGIPSLRVLSCADAIPAIPSTDEKKYPYNLVTQVFDSGDLLMDERKDVFEFTLPENNFVKEKKSLFRKLFGN